MEKMPNKITKIEAYLANDLSVIVMNEHGKTIAKFPHAQKVKPSRVRDVQLAMMFIEQLREYGASLFDVIILDEEARN